jgi:transcriptional regulator with XRE-family HTH domain
VTPRSSTSLGEDEGRLTPVDRRRIAIGAQLRDLRRGARLTQTQLAERVGISEQMVSHYEGGRYTPTTEMLGRFASALALPADTHTALADLLAELAIEVSTLRVVHRQGGERAIQASIGGQEQAASVVWDYQDEIVPGLLQTPDYTRAVVPLIDPTLPDIDDLVAGRSERQRVLYDRTKSFRFLLQEAALRGRVAPTDVLRGQLDRLQALAAALPHVELRVLPFAARLTARALTSYRVIDDTVEVELQRDTVTIRDPRDVTMYRDIFETLWRLALGGEEFTAFIRSVDVWLAGLDGSQSP